ncbi:hypothetical protein [Balneatrix alpica]|uniref:LysR substrate-binding domain-containing protein n=1 Tax=Balneatrix alpica TaxID=75684 RepID=A0ABV5Z9N7_9GAMM|nr:hypothetical protein [Balneatrix alpica]
MPYPSYLAASVPGLKLIPINGGRTLYPLRLLIRHSEPTPILAKMLMEAAIKTQQIS